MRTKFLAAAAIVGAIAILAACAIPSRTSNKLTATATDFSFEPLTWTVAAGQPASLTLVNNGAEEHEWVLIKKGEKITVPFDADDEDKVYWEIEAEGGESKTESFTAPTEPGSYDVVCGLEGHVEHGMTAQLIVE